MLVIPAALLLRGSLPLPPPLSISVTRNRRLPSRLVSHVSQTLVFVTCVSDMFCAAGYNARRQCVLAGKTPNQVVAERRTAKSAFAKDKPAGRAGPCTSPRPV